MKLSAKQDTILMHIVSAIIGVCFGVVVLVIIVCTVSLVTGWIP